MDRRGPLISLLFLLIGAGAAVFVSLMSPNSLGTIAPMVLIYGFFGLIMGYMLYLLLSTKKGSMVFSPEYKQVIERTPHIRYQTSWLVRLLLIIFVGLITFAVIGVFVARPG